MHKFSKKKMFIIILIIVLIIVLGIIYYFLYKNFDFFKIKFIDIIQSMIDIFIGYGIYKFTKKDNKEEKIDCKKQEILEKLIFIIDDMTPLEYCGSINSLRLKIREISNNIYLLEKLDIKNSKYVENINYIKDNYKKFEEYISEHTDMSIDKLFKDETRQNKLNTYIFNMRNKSMDTICDILLK